METASHLMANTGAWVDFHTHILPGVDDGSRSVAESIQMLRILGECGVGAVVLTPHFYADGDTPERFIARRARAYSELSEILSKDSSARLPRLVLGAEVEYFEGIACMLEYPELHIGNSGCILVEMPQRPWSAHIVDDILRLNNTKGFHVILAHVERYLFDQKKDVVHTLLENKVLMQSNASFFINHSTARKAIRMLRRGYIHLLGSDCHNLTSRPPNLGDACDAIVKNMGSDVLDDIMRGASRLLRCELDAFCNG